jgi:hypothetical protein
VPVVILNGEYAFIMSFRAFGIRRLAMRWKGKCLLRLKRSLCYTLQKANTPQFYFCTKSSD